MTLAKRYMVEQGSQWPKQTRRPSASNQILVAASARVEMLSRLSRQQRLKSISPTDFYRIGSTFSMHLRRQYRVISLNDTVLARAARLVQDYPRRSLDAMQLASALEARQVRQIADRRLALTSCRPERRLFYRRSPSTPLILRLTSAAVHPVEIPYAPECLRRRLSLPYNHHEAAF